MSRSMRLALSLVLGSAACGGTPAPTVKSPAAAAAPARDDRALRAFVEGASLLARGTERSTERAIERLGEAVSLDPALWEAHHDLGVALRRRGELAPAHEHFARAHALAPSAPEPLWGLAECELVQGARDDAAAHLEALVALDPAREDATLALAAVQRERGKLDEALARARSVLMRDPRSHAALLEVARVYRTEGALDVAELVLEKARALDDESAALHDELGRLALARGDTQLAFTHFERARTLDPRFLPAHLDEGSVLLRAGDYDAAERVYRAAVQVDGGPEAMIGLAIAQRGRGKYKEARATYEKVLKERPSEPAALFDLGVLLADFMDARAEAVNYFERYLAVAPLRDSHRETAERYLQDIRMSLGSPPP